MSKKLIKIIALTLCAVMCVCCISCDNCNDDTVSETVKVEYTGNHNSIITETDREFVKDGRTNYAILMPATSNEFLDVAKNELIILFRKATGITLPVVSDNNASSDRKYISLGRTNLCLDNIGLDKEAYSQSVLKTQGFIIKTVNDNIYILGATDYGVVNGVYKLLEIYFNYDYYYRNCIDIDTNVFNANFYEIEVTDVPDIDNFYTDENVFQWGRGKVQPTDYYALGTATAEEELKYINYRSGNFFSSNEMLMIIHEDFNTMSTGQYIHNVIEYLMNTELYNDDDCYASTKTQLCYTAHGNQEKLNKMIEVCADKIIFSLKNYTPDKYPLKNYVTFTIADTTEICNCPACKAEYAQIGYSGNLIRFANKLANKVQEWLNSQKDENAEFHNAYRENFKVIIYAYNAYTEPPLDDNGNLLSDDLMCAENLGIWHCSSKGVSAHADIYDEKWPGAVEQVAGWKKLTEKSKCLWFWHNSGNVANQAFYSDGFTIYSNNFMALMANAGYEYILGAHYLLGGNDLTAWQNLLIYVSNKLRWDCSRDSDFYIRKYMDAMYKDASETMYNLLQQERIYYQNLVVNAKKDNDWGRGIATTENYPYVVLKQWLNLLDKALSEVERYKTENPNLYSVLEARIEMETAAHLYRITSLYGATEDKPFSNSVLEQYNARIRRIGDMLPYLEINNKKLKDM